MAGSGSLNLILQAITRGWLAMAGSGRLWNPKPHIIDDYERLAGYGLQLLWNPKPYIIDGYERLAGYGRQRLAMDP